jgi:glycosyltransferase involved in cell wall biosynthesis
MTIDGAGGVFTYAVDLIRGLHAHGVQTSVVSLGPPLTRDQREALRAAGPAAHHATGFRLEWTEDPWEDLERARRFLRAVEERERPDVVHANSFFCGTVGFRAPCLVVAHSCVYSWWEAVHGTAPPPSWQRYHDVVRAGLRDAGAVVAPSRAMLDALRRHYGEPRDPGQVVHNGSAVRELRAPAKEPFALAAGRVWDEAKNLAVLERIAPSLGGRLVVAGPGGRRGRLTPHELGALRRRAAVYVAPARYEPFGLGILEAARDACALVLGDIESLRELWDGAAVFVAPGDLDALTLELQRLLDDAAAAAHLGERAQRRARRFTVEAMAAAYAEIYRTLAAREREVVAA